MRIPEVGLVLLGALASACSQGSITFSLDLPAPKLSPLSDLRAASITIVDESTGAPLGPSVGVHDQGRSALGNVHIGTYDLDMQVGGGGLLLGLARSRGVTIAAGVDQQVTLYLRKPFAFFGALPLFGTAPSAVMAFDTTLPPGGIEPDLGNIQLPASMSASASTFDGRFLFIAAKDHLYVVNTADLTTLSHVAATGGMIRAIVVAPNDHAAALLTDGEIDLISDLAAFDSSGPAASPLVPIALANPIAAAFSPDGETLAVISGLGTWDSIAALTKSSWQSCNGSIPKTSLSMISVAAPPAIASPVPLPNGATDVNWIAKRPVVTLPCGAGAVFVDDLTDLANLPVAIAGHGVLDLAVSGDRTAIIEGRIVNKMVPVDPEEPRVTNALLPFGQITILDPNGTVTSTFPLPTDQLDFNGSDMTVVQARLAPIRIDAYDIALSPDGTHVVMAGRMRYEANAFPYVPEFADPNVSGLTYYCDLNLSEDVYHVMEIEATSGSVAYQSVTGVNDSVCSTQCFSCVRPCHDCQPSCTPLTNPERTSCTVSNGYPPGGLSVMMGGE